MKKWFLLLSLFTFEAFAIEAVVTVLETPMLKSKSYDAPVVQYLRKGDVIKLHPSINNTTDFDKYAPSPAKYSELKTELENSPQQLQDPLFKGVNPNIAYIEDEFIPMLDRQGNTVYVISSHIYVYFNDTRELGQKVIAKDPTDYRLEEPLPKNYPLKTPSGYRGQFILGITQPNFESYNYPDSYKTKGYSSPVDMSYTLLRQAPGNYQERLFIGGTLNFRHYENSFTFFDKRLAEEEGLRLGLGPTISYDAYKGIKNRINISGTIMVNFIDRLSVQQSLGDIQDNREYIGYSLAPRINVQYHRKAIHDDLDIVLGTSMEMVSATSFRAKNAGKQPSWWQNLGDDKFITRTTFTLGGYVGIQTAY